MKHVLLVTLSLFSCLVMAQAQRYTIRGKVVSQVDGSPVELAAVRLFSYAKNGDSTMVQGAQANMDGEYQLTDVAAGKYKLYAGSLGFVESATSIQVKNDHLIVPDIRLAEDVQLLQEVQVKGHAAEMTVKGDTIEYNTAAVKVGENAMVEELLKKMNGIEVDKEGNITVNGEQIKGVRVDGKKFFGNDVQSATKNIPAEMIEKIQVIDQKSEMAQLTGFEDDETERIINLTLKPDRKKGVFGNYNGGLGADIYPAFDKWTAKNDLRYSAGLMTNILLGESQTTIMANANNTNEIRSGRGRGNLGGQNAGLTRAENIGINTNIDLNDHLKYKRDAQTNMVFGGDVTVNHSHNDTESELNKESYSAGNITFGNHNRTTSTKEGWDLNARLELEYQIDTLNKLILQPRITYSNSHSSSNELYSYTRQDSIKTDSINDGTQQRYSRSEQIGTGLKAIYSHSFYKPGRKLTMNAEVGYTNTKGYSSTFNRDSLHHNTTLDQYTNSGNDAINYNLKVSFVEPIYGRNHFLETAITISGNSRNSNKDQMTMDTISHTYQSDSVYSNKLQNDFFSEAIELNYQWIEQDFNLTVGIKFNPSQTHSISYYGGKLNRDKWVYAWNWSPNASFKYNFGKKQYARITYRGTTTQPSLTQIEPVRNNSNAMNETIGNLSLKPAFRHSLRLMYSKFNQDNFSNLMAGIQANLTKDALVNNSIYDEKGKLYQQTVNAKSLPFDVSANLMYSTPFANKMLQFNTRTTISYNQRIAYINHDAKAADIEAAIAANQVVLGSLSRTGNVRASEDLSLRLTHDIVDLGIRGRVTYSYSINSANSKNTTHVLDWTITGDIVFHLPKQWNISADCGYTARYGYTGLTDVNEILLNASIDKTWKNATLTLKAFDILNNHKNIVQTVGENYVSYQKVNTLPTYIMLTFTYKMNNTSSSSTPSNGIQRNNRFF